MTIKIYPGQMPSEPIETHPWVGTIAGWFEDEGIDYMSHEQQPITLLVNGSPLSSEMWAETKVAADDVVEIRPAPFGFVAIAYAAVVALFAYTYYQARNLGQNRFDSQQGQRLQSAEARANSAKLNQVVPEHFGKFLRYPDYLVPPRRYFARPREQFLEMLLCVGPGRYAIDGSTVRIASTALSGLPGAEFHIYRPGERVDSHGMHANWHSCPEVGGTSAGTAGIELSASPESNINPDAPLYTFSGKTLSAERLPSVWAPGTLMDITITDTFSVIDAGGGSFSNFVGNFQDIADLEVGSPVNTPLTNRPLVIASKEFIAGEWNFTFLLNDTIRPFRISPGSYNTWFKAPGRNYRLVSSSETIAVLEALENGAVVADWYGFPSKTFNAESVRFDVVPNLVLGAWAGPYKACPSSENPSALEYDIFYPQGLSMVEGNGDLSLYSSTVEVQWRVPGGQWHSSSNTVRQRTLDQIGFTNRLTITEPGVPEVRMRRVGAVSTSTQINDKVQWYGLRALLKSPEKYDRWTTIAIRIRGMGDIGASSENQVNLVATRILPTLRNDGTWSADDPTRDISAAVKHICTTIGYADENLDMSELQRMHQLWTSRGESFDNVFDEVTVKQAIDTCFSAGMSEMTIEDGRIRPVRDGIRTLFEQSYSAQNATEGGITRTFTGHRPDDNDGVEIEFQDEADGWTTATIRCFLPGSLGIRLEKMKLQGVTDRTRAWRIGMRRARELRYRRWAYTFGTELDALNSSYGSYVGLVPDVPGLGQSAILQQISDAGGQARLSITEPLQWSDGEPHVVAFRNPDGSLAGPWKATPGADDYELVAPIPKDEWPVINLKQEPPHVYFGTEERWAFRSIVRSVKPGSNDSVQVQAVNYDERIFEDDDRTPPPK